MERGLRYLGCEMEGGTHSQGHLHSPYSERLHPGGGDRLRKEGSFLGGQAKQWGIHPGADRLRKEVSTLVGEGAG